MSLCDEVNWDFGDSVVAGLELDGQREGEGDEDGVGTSNAGGEDGTYRHADDDLEDLIESFHDQNELQYYDNETLPVPASSPYPHPRPGSPPCSPRTYRQNANAGRARAPVLFRKFKKNNNYTSQQARFAQLNESDLDQLLKDATSKATNNQTKAQVNILKRKISPVTN